VFRRNLVALALSLCLTSAAAIAAEPSEPASPREALITSLNHALSVADLDGLTARYGSKDPVEHALAAMAIERVHGNFEQSSNIGRTCESSLKTSEPFVAHYCARFVAANLRLMGERQKAATEEKRIAEAYRTSLPSSVINNPDLTQATLYETLPIIKASVPEGITTIPLKKNVNRSTMVDVMINGKSQQMKLATGAYTILGEDTAKDLGVKVLLEKDGTIRGPVGAPGDKKLGFIEKLKIGDIEVDNVPVSLVRDEKTNLLGIDVLHRLGSFEVQRDALIVYGANATQPACETPLLVSTNFWGGVPRVLAQITVDGVPENALFDTGTTLYLTSNQPATQGPLQAGGQLRLKDVNSGSQAVRFSRTTSNIDMAGKRYQLTYATMEDIRVNQKYILGEGALQDVNLFVDFKKRVSCLFPRFPGK
jgi:clan AA aspartic protease (TIGR02281 family)